MNAHAVLSQRFDFHCYETGESVPFAMNGLPQNAAGAPMSLRCLATPAPEILECPPLSMWDYADFLPVAHAGSVVSLEEARPRSLTPHIWPYASGLTKCSSRTKP